MISTDNARLLKRAKGLAVFTIAYNLIEGAVSVYYGVEENSVSLAGFGIDSFVEVLSAAILYWKISGHQTDPAREQLALKGIGVLFMLLAVTTFGSAAYQLLTKQHPETTLPGLVISATSLSFMLWLWKAKKGVGEKLKDPVILGDAACSLACIQLSVVLFMGSLVFWVAPGLWWADAAAALVLTYFITKEGLSFLRADASAGAGCGCN